MVALTVAVDENNGLLPANILVESKEKVRLAMITILKITITILLWAGEFSIVIS